MISGEEKKGNKLWNDERNINEKFGIEFWKTWLIARLYVGIIVKGCLLYMPNASLVFFLHFEARVTSGVFYDTSLLYALHVEWIMSQS